jgi:hypothetical protein
MDSGLRRNDFWVVRRWWLTTANILEQQRVIKVRQFRGQLHPQMHANPATAQAMADWPAFGDIEGVAQQRK